MQALDRCHLTPLLNHKPTDEEPTLLDMKMNSDSLSAGEKQLIALARATLRRTSIIIMDEATSQIDSRLDDQVITKIKIISIFHTNCVATDRSSRRFARNSREQSS